ncbi:MAG: DUF2271 domain-containing protein [Ferrimonas sp.]
MKLIISALAGALLSTSVMAAPVPASAQLTIDLEIADTGDANPARPYVAIWLENEDNQMAAQWALWTGSQTEWLKDIRTWYRKFGRYQVDSIDGYSSATRAIGAHSIKPPLTDLAGKPLSQGQYTLYIEAVREHGGRDLIRQPLQLTQKSQQLSLPAQAELGAITITYQVK